MNSFGLGRLDIYIFKGSSCSNTQKYMRKEKWRERETLVNGIFGLVFYLCWGHYEKERLYKELDTIKLTFKLLCFKWSESTYGSSITIRKIELCGWNQTLPVPIKILRASYTLGVGLGLLMLCIYNISLHFPGLSLICGCLVDPWTKLWFRFILQL